MANSSGKCSFKIMSDFFHQQVYICKRKANLVEASSSMAVPGVRKWVTSAICTPSSRLPFSSSRMCSASSMSLQPGGSTLQMGRCRKSSLQVQQVKPHTK